MHPVHVRGGVHPADHAHVCMARAQVRPILPPLVTATDKSVHPGSPPKKAAKGTAEYGSTSAVYVIACFIN